MVEEGKGSNDYNRIEIEEDYVQHDDGTECNG